MDEAQRPGMINEQLMKLCDRMSTARDYQTLTVYVTHRAVPQVTGAGFDWPRPEDDACINLMVRENEKDTTYARIVLKALSANDTPELLFRVSVQNAECTVHEDINVPTVH